LPLSSVVVGRHGLWVSHQSSVVSRGLWTWSVVGRGWSWLVVTGHCGPWVIMGRQSSVISQLSVMVFGHGQQLVVNHQLWSVMISCRSSVVVVVSHAVVVICRSSSVIGHLSSPVNHQSVNGDGAEGGDGDKEGVDGTDEEDGDRGNQGGWEDESQ